MTDEKIKLQSMLIPIDGSDASFEAARYALKVAKMSNMEATCIHLIDTPPLIKQMNPVLTIHYFSEAEKKAREWITRVEKLAEKQEVRITSEILLDIPTSVAEAIIDYATKKQIDLIVMGSRGRGNIKKVLLGSVTNAVVARAPCPVMVIR
jgi:nucleotide-binding universal stress UspA family protein